MKSTLEAPDRSCEMDEKTWWDFWNKSYRTVDNNDDVSSELFTRTAALIKAVADPGGSSVLEIACGTGSLSRMLTFERYHGLDISSAAIDIARQKEMQVLHSRHSNVPTYEAADFHDWPSPSKAYDLALCIDAISCFRDPGLVMRKMAQSLRTGGLIVLTTINPFVYRRIRRVGGVKLANGPVSHWMSRAELEALFDSAGLLIERSFTVMPRGDRGILRFINSRKLNYMFGPEFAELLRRGKERIGLGQYRVVVARKVHTNGDLPLLIPASVQNEPVERNK